MVVGDVDLAVTYLTIDSEAELCESYFMIPSSAFGSRSRG